MPASDARRGRPRRSGFGARVLRGCQYFFLLVGFLAAAYCAWFYGEGKAAQAYQSWRFDQLVGHRAASFEAYLKSYFARIPYLGSPSVRHGAASFEAYVKSQYARIPYLVSPSVRHGAASLEAYVEDCLARIPRLGSRWRRAPSTTAFSPPTSSAGPPARPPRPTLAEGALIGRLEVPRLGLSTIVLEGDSDSVLREAAGHIPGTALPGAPGNVGIAAHRDTLFRPLKNVRRNDRIVLRTTAGTYQYAVQSVQIVAPDDTQVLDSSGRASLTLVTCYPFYYVGSAPERYIVRAREIAPAQALAAGSADNAAFASGSEMKVVAFRAPQAHDARRAAHHGPGRRWKRPMPERAPTPSAGPTLVSRSRVALPSAAPSDRPGDDPERASLSAHADPAGDASPRPATLPRHHSALAKAGRHIGSWLKSFSKKVTGNDRND